MNLLEFLFGRQLPASPAADEAVRQRTYNQQQLTPPLDEDEATLAARRAANWKAWEEMERKLDAPNKEKR